MIETKEKEINGSRYTVTQMTARRALRMKAKLLRLFGAPLAQLFLPSGEEPIDGMAFSKDEAVKALQSLAMELDDKTFEFLIVELLKEVRKDGVELTESVIDLEFAGDLLTLFKVVWFVLEANFGSFFGEGGIGDLFTAPQTQKQVTVKRSYTKKSKTK